MIDVVIMPSYFRPEYLALALEYLAAADGADSKEVWVSQDRHTNDMAYMTNELPLVREVAMKFRTKFFAFEYREQPATPYIGNPYNFLESYKAAFNRPDVRYVYLVEDDVLVSKDFFKWHEAVYEKVPNAFISVGWHCVRNPEAVRDTNPETYITSYRDFSSIGVCWKRENLAPFVRHARPEYYRDMAVYLRGAFPGSPIPAGQWTEQAGIVTRLLHEAPGERLVVWPTLRRCSHVGVSGYHRPRGYKFTGSLDQRIEALRKAVTDRAIQGMSHDFEDDIEPVTISGEWGASQLREVQHVPYVPGKI